MKPRMDQAGRPRRAFTLVELVVVMAILGIVAAIASPRMGQAMARRRLDACEHRIIADMGLARSTARATSASVTMRFGVASSSYKILGVVDPDTGSAAYTVDMTRSPYHATFQSADFGGDDTVVFDGYGVPDSAGFVVVAVAGEGRVLALGSGGEAAVATLSDGKIEDPGDSGIKIDPGDLGDLQIQ